MPFTQKTSLRIARAVALAATLFAFSHRLPEPRTRMKRDCRNTTKMWTSGIFLSIMPSLTTTRTSS